MGEAVGLKKKDTASEIPHGGLNPVMADGDSEIHRVFHDCFLIEKQVAIIERS